MHIILHGIGTFAAHSSRRRPWWTTACCVWPSLSTSTKLVVVPCRHHFQKWQRWNEQSRALVGMNATWQSFAAAWLPAWTCSDHWNRCPFFCSHSVLVRFDLASHTTTTSNNCRQILQQPRRHILPISSCSPSNCSILRMGLDRSVWPSLVVGTIIM